MQQKSVSSLVLGGEHKVASSALDSVPTININKQAPE